jgi:hypothetical protein
MKAWMLCLLMLACLGCSKPSEIVGQWRPLDPDGKGLATKIEFFANGKCRLDGTGRVYEWTLSDGKLILRHSAKQRPILARVEFPDLEHMEFTPWDWLTGQELPPQKLKRVTKE